MIDRREFLGAVAALFAGVVLPEPVRESIWVGPATWPAWGAANFPEPVLTEATIRRAYDAIMRKSVPGHIHIVVGGRLD